MVSSILMCTLLHLAGPFFSFIALVKYIRYREWGMSQASSALFYQDLPIHCPNIAGDSLICETKDPISLPALTIHTLFCFFFTMILSQLPLLIIK